MVAGEIREGDVAPGSSRLLKAVFRRNTEHFSAGVTAPLRTVFREDRKTASGGAVDEIGAADLPGVERAPVPNLATAGRLGGFPRENWRTSGSTRIPMDTKTGQTPRATKTTIGPTAPGAA